MDKVLALGERSENDLLAIRTSLTRRLESDPYAIDAYWQRAQVYESLAYPELAVMDYYKVLLLTDEVLDESEEYHIQAFEAVRRSIATKSLMARIETIERHAPHLGERFTKDVGWEDAEVTLWTNHVWARNAPVYLARQLAIVGCLRTAYDFVQNALRKHANHEAALEEKGHIERLAEPHFAIKGMAFNSHDFNPNDLPDQGFVRREVYPWNTHEQDRMSKQSLEFLNKEMSAVAPNLEIKLTCLPFLHAEGSQSQLEGRVRQHSSITQLGVFAKKDLQPGKEVFRERSLLTANARLHEPLCDACSALLPQLEDGRSDTAEAHSVGGPKKGKGGPISCPDCDDAAFCSNECLNMAQGAYHATVCGRDVEPLGKDVPPIRASDALYNQLLFRALALSVCQSVHPLDLKETKYIWGGFRCREPLSQALGCLDDAERFYRHTRTLPYDFQSQVLEPLHFLELLDLPIFSATNNLSETWVYNTLLAKFRGTASARISPRDGRPEVAAVHPLWCLANHSCDPNVQWEWAGEIQFTVREKRVAWTKHREYSTTMAAERGPKDGGIRKGEEILNHYVDVDLPVKERREWGVGALGGLCMCERCVWEAD